MFDQDDSHGAAQQSPSEETNLATPVQRPIIEEIKEPEPYEGASMNYSSVNFTPKSNRLQ